MHKISGRNEITRAFINKLVSIDEICRGGKGITPGWKLHKGPELYKLINKFIRDYSFILEVPTIMTDDYYSCRTAVGYNKFLMKSIIDEDTINDMMNRSNTVTSILKIGNGKLLLAGSGAHTFLPKRTKVFNYCTDYDFFFIGCSGDNKEKEAENIINDVINFLNLGDNILIVRTEHAITIKYDDRVAVQFILRLYPDTGNLDNNISMVLGGFDLYYCALGLYYDPATESMDLYAPTTTAFCIARRVNIVNIGRMSESYAYRNKKYCSRHVNLMVPQMTGDGARSLTRERAGLYKTCSPSYMGMIFPIPKVCAPNVSHKESDYDSVQSSENYNIDYNTHVFSLANIRALLTGRTHNYVRVGNSMEDVLVKQDEQLSNIDRYIKIWLECKSSDYYISTSSYSGASYYSARKTYSLLFLPLEEYRLRINPDEFAEEKLAILNATNRIERNKSESLLTVAIRTQAYQNMKDTYLTTKFIEKMRETAIKLLPEIMKLDKEQNERMNGGLKWVVDNPGTQQTATFNPEIVDPASMFPPGIYKSFKVGFPDDLFVPIMIGLGKYFTKSTIKLVIMPYIVKAWANHEEMLLIA
jgi:hypothetical protein